MIYSLGRAPFTNHFTPEVQCVMIAGTCIVCLYCILYSKSGFLTAIPMHANGRPLAAIAWVFAWTVAAQLSRKGHKKIGHTILHWWLCAETHTGGKVLIIFGLSLENFVVNMELRYITYMCSYQVWIPCAEHCSFYCSEHSLPTKTKLCHLARMIYIYIACPPKAGEMWPYLAKL